MLIFVHSPAGICAISAAAGFSSAFFRPGCYSAIPNLVAEDSLVAANALVQGAENLSTLIGPVLAGVAIVAAGLGHRLRTQLGQLPRLGAAASSASAARLQSNVPARIGRTHWREVRAGLRLVRTDHHLSSIFLIWSWATLAYTGINVAEIVLTTEAYGVGNPGFGIFVACSAAGILIGNVVAFWFIDKPHGVRRLPRLVPRHRGGRRACARSARRSRSAASAPWRSGSATGSASSAT